MSTTSFLARAQSRRMPHSVGVQLAQRRQIRLDTDAGPTAKMHRAIEFDARFVGV